MLRVAIVKPNWRITGGFELVVDQVAAHLARSGHDVSVVEFDAWHHDSRPFGIRVSDDEWAQAPTFFGYMAQVEKARRLRLDRADVVISTQPPSFCVEHPRHLALFYHHARVFYELRDVVERAGLVDPAAHALASEAVRAVDAVAIAGISHILAGSETVAGRLSAAHGPEIASVVSVFHAGPAVQASVEGRRSDADTVLCVSRHDFPKRTELFVHAMNVLRPERCVSIGQGGRLGSVMAFDRRLALLGRVDDLPAEEVWLNGPDWVDPATVPGTGTVEFKWEVPPDALRSELQRAACFVAPAFDEDYGLTVLEAMAEGVPVVVCEDGGHLAHLVQDGLNGLVCEPTGPAIAAAVRKLLDDPKLADELGANGRELARRFTWERAFQEFDEGLERVVGCA